MKNSFKKIKMMFGMLLVIGLCAVAGTGVVQAQVEPYLGEIRMFAGNFAPVGWALCDGSLLSIQQNTALFSVIGTYYGGNGTTNFALPDLRGRFPMGFGTGPGLTPRNLGDKGGAETVTLNVNQIPAHTHTVTVNAQNTEGSAAVPDNGYWAKSGQGAPQYNSSANTTMNANAVQVGSSGGGSRTPTYHPINASTLLSQPRGSSPPAHN